MIGVLLISIASILLMLISIILFPKIKIKKFEFQTFWIFPFIGALIILIFGFIDFDYCMSELTSKASINPIKILILFISMSFLSIILDELNFFEYLANFALKKAKGRQIHLFIILYLLCSILTIFTSNDIIILTFTPFIIFFSKNAKINPIPYLVLEFVAANTWSMFFIIGNPTNIYLATKGNISFIDYFKTMYLATIFSGIISFSLLIFLFRKELKKPLECDITDCKIKNKLLMIINLICLGCCTILLVISSYINLEMYLISAVSAISLLVALITISIIFRTKEILINGLKRIPYTLIPFVLSMFVIVLSLKDKGIIEEIGKLLNNKLEILTYGLSSFLSCSLINNIPMSVLFSEISSTNIEIYASIIGSNIGAFLTPIGALAGIMWLSILKKHAVKFNFLSFVKYGLIISVPTLLFSLLGLFIVI